MATITSTGSGNWNSTTPDAPWPSGTVPAVTDTVYVDDTHTVTITAGFTQTAGSINVNGGGTLVGTGGQILTIEGGATLNLLNDASTKVGNLSHTGTGVFQIKVNAATSYVSATGLSTSTRCQIWGSSNANSIRILNGATFYRNGLVRLQYAHLKYMGTSGSTYAIYAVPTGAGDTFYLKDCLVEYCGEIFLDESGGINATADLQFLRNTHQNSQGTYTHRFGSANAKTGGNRLFQRNVCDKRVYWILGRGWTIGESTPGDGLGNYFNDALLIIESSTSPPVSAIGNFIRIPDTTGINMVGGDWKRNIVFQDVSGTNPHGMVMGKYANHEISDNIYECTGANHNGDAFLLNTTTNAIAITFKNNLQLPGRDSGDYNRGPGTLVTVTAAATPATTIALDHNTSPGYCESTFWGMFGMQEIAVGYAGIVSSCKSNLSWSATADAGVIAANGAGGGSPTQDYVASGDMDYNGKWQLDTGSNGVGYDNFDFSSGSPGANDVTVSADPFVDKSRDFAAWAVSEGSGSGTEAGQTTDGLGYLKLRNESTWNSSSTILACWTWIRAGFYVTDATLDSAGHDSATIGALPYGTSATANPGVGAMTMTGPAPTVSAAVTASPNIGALILTGPNPTVDAGVTSNVLGLMLAYHGG